jgi:ArsR family transcriptional regulator, cadmium/lead-responsive transcriptional repressor
LQENVVKLEPLAGVIVGRESEEMCLLARLFNGFANSTRLSILLLLSQRGEMKVGELVHELEAPQPRVSDHLRCLSSCGYVQVRREGRNAYYSVSDDRIMTILSLGEELLRDNQDRLLACETIKKDC